MSASTSDSRSLLHGWAEFLVVQHGLAVFPLPPLRKRPAEGGLGIRAATTNLAQIEQWWTTEPNFNIGVCGDPNATEKFLLRVDVDVKRGGMDAWNQLIAKHGAINTLTTRTPSGGLHLYLRTTTPYDNSVGNLPAGIDIRGHLSGYTVGAGSVTIAVPKESVAGSYRSDDPRALIAQAPQWLLDLIKEPKQVETECKAADLTPEILADLRSALTHPAMLQDWRRWSDNGYALRTLGDAGQALWVEYSQAQIEACPNETLGNDNAHTWWNKHRPESVKSDYRSIFARAQSLGWKNPKALDTSTLGFGDFPTPIAANVAKVMTVPARFQIINGREFANGPDPEWRIDEVLPEQGLAMIFGQSGCGKSFFALDLAMAIARGTRYGLHQRQVKQGRVLYVVAEGAGGFRQRLRAYDQHHRLAASDPTLSLIAAAPNLMDGGDSTLLRDVILDKGGADVVVIDTVHASMSGGEENSAKDMGTVLGHCRAIQEATGGLVVLIHHSGKDTDRGARGSSAIRAAMDTEIEVIRSEGDQRTARVTKQRDGQDNIIVTCFELRLVFGAGVVPGAVVAHVEPKMASKKRTSGIKDCMIEILRDFPDGLAVDDLFMRVVMSRKDDGGKEPRRDNLNRSLKDLTETGTIRGDDGRVKLLLE